MANTIAAGLKLDVILDEALRAFSKEILPLKAFSTAFYDQPLHGTNKVSVPYFPLESAASTDFDGTYVFGNTDTQLREVTINKRKYQSMSFTSSEVARQPQLRPEEYGRVKGQKLAEDVITDILSLVTAANYGAAGFTGLAATFDSDDVVDIGMACTQANWPRIGRSLILSPAYYAGLIKDKDIKSSPSVSITDEAMKAGRIPQLHGFGVHETIMIPANAENLVGMVVYSSAVLVAFSPIAPAPDVLNQLTDYRSVTDPASGITLEYRAWGSADTDTAKAVIECNYGFGKGEAAAIKRMVSA